MSLLPSLSPHSPECAIQIKYFKPEAAAEPGRDQNIGWKKMLKIAGSSGGFFSFKMR